MIELELVNTDNANKFKNRRAIAYIRVGDGSHPFKNAKWDYREIDRYQDRTGIKIVALLIDHDAESGHLEFSDRPAGRMLLSLAKEQSARNIVVARMYAPFKDTVDAARHFKVWRKHRIKLHVACLNGEPYVNEGPDAVIFNNAVEALARIERWNVRERIRSSHYKRKARGFVYGAIPYGYKRMGTVLIEDDEQLKVVQRMKRMNTYGLTYGQIAKILNDEGVPTQKGATWYPSTVRGIVNNEPPGNVEYINDQGIDTTRSV
jgi:DNA invertase Pin-like site-specific DNA recombinase